jgi:hypothetical protein
MDTQGGPRLRAAQVLFYAAGTTVSVGFDAAITGSLQAPLGAVTLQDRSVLSGRVGGKTLTIGFDATVGDGTPSPVCDASNLVSNGGFEAGTTPWSPSPGAGLATTTSRAHGPTHSGSVTGRTSTSQGAVQSLLGSAPRGATYDVVAWASPSTSTAQSLVLAARVRCNGGSDQQIQIAQGTGNNTGFTRLAGTLTVPNCPLGALDVTIQGPPAGVGLLVDDVSVVQRCP